MFIKPANFTWVGWHEECFILFDYQYSNKEQKKISPFFSFHKIALNVSIYTAWTALKFNGFVLCKSSAFSCRTAFISATNTEDIKQKGYIFH